MFWRRILNRLIHFFTANVGLKIGSLILAVILWITITGQGTADRVIRDVPYQIRNIPEGMELTDKGAGVIQVRLRGPKSLIPTLKNEDFSISIKLPDDIKPGNLPLSISRSDLTTPYSNQLSILQIVPSVVTVTLDSIVQKTVAIKPFLKGSTDPDYELGQWRVSPPEALIEGPSSILDGIETVNTESIDVAGQSLSFDDRVAIKPQNSLIQVIEPNRVTARIEIVERITERSFPEFEISLVPEINNETVVLSPSVVTLSMIGPAAVLNRLKPTDIQLIVDWSNLESGDHTVTPVLVSNEDRIISLKADPSEVMITVPIPSPTPSPTPSPSPSPSPPATISPSLN